MTSVLAGAYTSGNLTSGNRTSRNHTSKGSAVVEYLKKIKKNNLVICCMSKNIIIFYKLQFKKL